MALVADALAADIGAKAMSQPHGTIDRIDRIDLRIVDGDGAYRFGRPEPKGMSNSD